MLADVADYIDQNAKRYAGITTHRGIPPKHDRHSDCDNLSNLKKNIFISYFQSSVLAFYVESVFLFMFRI